MADAVGVTPPNLYNHFRSKRALYEAVLDRGIAPLMEILGRSQAESWSEAATVRMLEDMLSYLHRSPHLPRLVYFEMLSGGEDLRRVAESWIRPLLVTAVAALEDQRDDDWDLEELPLLVSAWFNLVCGHFVTAELMREAFGPGSAAPDERTQVRFFIRLWRRIAPAPVSTELRPVTARPEATRGAPAPRSGAAPTTPTRATKPKRETS